MVRATEQSYLLVWLCPIYEYWMGSSWAAQLWNAVLTWTG